jgi:acyl-CoA synthetase (AMP-forming)/AMP-acid ligase II
MTALWQTWRRTARRLPDRVMVTEADTGRAVVAAELTAAAERRAAALPGGVVAFTLPNSAAWLAEFLAIQRRGAIALPLEPGQQPPRCAARRGVCLIKTTSGTTGVARPIYCTAANLLADARQVCATMGITAADVNLALIPFGHSYGLGNLVLPMLQQGTPVVCAAAFVPRQIPDWIERHRVTVFPTVPAVLRALVQLPGRAAMPSLRLVISAGAPLTPELARQFHEKFGVRVHNFYGASETGGICYDRDGSGRGVGHPLRGVRVTIRRDGRIVVASRAVTGSGRLVLADWGEWGSDGELILTGRVGAVANIGGRKVAAAVVETAVRGLPGVTEAWVTVGRDPRGNDLLAAAVETGRPRAALERALAQRLPLWQLPKRWLIAERLPRTARGKLDTAA